MDILKQFKGKINGALETFDRLILIINGYLRQLHSFRLFLYYLIQKKIVCEDSEETLVSENINGICPENFRECIAFVRTFVYNIGEIGHTEPGKEFSIWQNQQTFMRESSRM